MRCVMGRWGACAVTAGLLLTSMGCVPMRGSSSLTLLSRDLTRKSPEIVVVSDKVTESDTWTWALLFLMTGALTPSHEAVIDRILDEYNADLLVEAEMDVKTYGIPYIFMQSKYRVSGYPARFVKGGQ